MKPEMLARKIKNAAEALNNLAAVLEKQPWNPEELARAQEIAVDLADRLARYKPANDASQ